METKIIEDKKTGEFYVVEYDPSYPTDAYILGKVSTREEAEKLLTRP